MILKFGNLTVFSSLHSLLSINGLLVNDPVGLITCAILWISVSVTSGFSWISAGSSFGDLEQRKKMVKMCCVFRAWRETLHKRDEMKRLFWAHVKKNLEPKMWYKE